MPKANLAASADPTTSSPSQAQAERRAFFFDLRKWNDMKVLPALAIIASLTAAPAFADVELPPTLPLINGMASITGELDAIAACQGEAEIGLPIMMFRYDSAAAPLPNAAYSQIHAAYQVGRMKAGADDCKRATSSRYKAELEQQLNDSHDAFEEMTRKLVQHVAAEDLIPRDMSDMAPIDYNEALKPIYNDDPACRRELVGFLERSMERINRAPLDQPNLGLDLITLKSAEFSLAKGKACDFLTALRAADMEKLSKGIDEKIAKLQERTKKR